MKHVQSEKSGEVLLHYDSVQSATIAVKEMNGLKIQDKNMEVCRCEESNAYTLINLIQQYMYCHFSAQVQFGVISSPHVWLGNLKGVDFTAVHKSLDKLGSVQSFRKFPVAGVAIVEMPSSSMARIAELSMKGREYDKGVKVLVSIPWHGSRLSVSWLLYYSCLQSSLLSADAAAAWVKSLAAGGDSKTSKSPAAGQSQNAGKPTLKFKAAAEWERSSATNTTATKGERN